MTGAVTRRGLLKGGAAAVVGWSVAGGLWVTEAGAATMDASGLARVPRLDGTLESSADVLGSFGKDFGGLVTTSPKAVFRPGSVRDVQKMVAYATENRIKIAMNGQAGSGADIESHSSYGQAGVNGGIAIDAKSLSTIHSIDDRSADVDAGVTWAQLTDAALAKGKTPPALTDYLHLSVGGTISVGGIGGQVAKYGLQCDLVEELTIVVGDGSLLTCSASLRPDLFNAALAGGGQVGIIVRAKVKLVRAPERALVLGLYYDDLATYLADGEKILAEGTFDGQAGEIVRKADDSGWRYKIEAVAYHAASETPDRDALLAGLRDDRASLTADDYAYRDYAFRLDPFEAFLKEGGYWEGPKPWLSLVLPASRVREFVESAAAELTAADLGGGFLLFYPFFKSKLTRPMFAMPSEPVAYLFDLLRFPNPGEQGIQRMLEQNRRLYDRAVALGGKRYLVGAIPGMTAAEWRRHFGANWDRLAMAKRLYDPAGVLTPGQGFFA
ncbi:FAD-binding protein [Nonomuraea sp. B12E4]|uniref:FAD-binding protein n=1 Tax=Nonomuraea sp. B12E4 TaxID=3153564 RepID=UPI00325E958C